MGLVYGGIILVLFLAGRRWEAVGGGFAALGGAGINALVKHLVDRPRPSPLTSSTSSITSRAPATPRGTC